MSADGKIHESDYGDKNYHIVRRGETLSVDLTYPNMGEGRVQHVEVNQESVRASDGIRLTYDYERDGWSIQQPQLHEVLVEVKNGCACYESREEWIETAFVQSWALENVVDPPA